MAPDISALVGLGNPGPGHAHNRHNAGFWLADEVARHFGGSFLPQRRFHGEAAQANVDGHTLRMLKPTTYMNLSGRAVRALCDFYKLEPGTVIVAHDDLDLEPGVVRLKRGGGHGGHNGLRDVSSHIGPDFLRLRIGIGHPRDARGGEVLDWVLKQPSAAEAEKIRGAIDAVVDEFPRLLGERGVERVMEVLNRRA